MALESSLCHKHDASYFRKSMALESSLCHKHDASYFRKNSTTLSATFIADKISMSFFKSNRFASGSASFLSSPDFNSSTLNKQTTELYYQKLINKNEYST
jgi:hypothetical protein